MISELKVMSSGSAEPALDDVADAFSRATGQSVIVTYDDKIIADGPGSFDVILSSVDALDRNFRPRGAVEEGAVAVGRMGLGLAIRSGAPALVVTGLDSFRQVLAALDTLIVTTHTSGIYVEEVVARLGLGPTLAQRIERYANGPLAMDRLLVGSGSELLVLSVNQIRRYADRGIVYAGPLPDEVQLFRDFVVVPLAASCNKSVAWDFVRFCGGPGRSILADAGFSQAS